MQKHRHLLRFHSGSGSKVFILLMKRDDEVRVVDSRVRKRAGIGDIGTGSDTGYPSNIVQRPMPYVMSFVIPVVLPQTSEISISF